MKRLLVLSIVFGLGTGGLVGGEAQKDPPKPQPRVEVAFVLDTTGSMSGLIAGAKAKVWYIANQIVLGKPRPVVRMALVPYRDKGDAYVTQVFDLTDNIDEVYANLMKFQAQGGGDTPENVNQALHDAVHKLSWSKDRATLKIIYLVGDSPPHNEYTDVPTYDKTAKAAIEKGIYVNTILCGPNSQTLAIWKEIARRAEGTFLAIAQDGGVQEVATPYDAELGKLNRELLETAVVYGDKADRAKQSRLNALARGYAAPAAAERASFSAETGAVSGSDLVDDVRNKALDVDKLEKDKLPEPMQKMSAEELKKLVATTQARRDEINKQIRELSAKRAEHVRKELAKAPKPAEGFDASVVESLKTQAARKNITYK